MHGGEPKDQEVFALSKITALSPLGERVARCRRFHQPERAG
jgi:hypothetical protein